jgi:hypothetical protein
MKCYNHQNVDAVGVCKNCRKGICHDCLTDVGNGIACTATCIREVTEINRTLKKRRNSGKLGYFFLIIMGFLLFSKSYARGWLDLLFVMSIVLIVWGIIALGLEIKNSYGRK